MWKLAFAAHRKDDQVRLPGGFRRSYIDLWHRENLEIPQVEAEIASTVERRNYRLVEVLCAITGGAVLVD